MNECYRDTTLCSEPKMKCLDTEGSYECVCADGFKENDKVEFIDSETNKTFCIETRFKLLFRVYA